MAITNAIQFDTQVAIWREAGDVIDIIKDTEKGHVTAANRTIGQVIVLIIK